MSPKFSLALCLVSVALTLPAEADGIPAPAQAFIDTLEQQFTLKPKYGDVEIKGDGSIVINNLAFASGDFTAKADRVIIAEVAEQGDGWFDAGNVRLDGVKFEWMIPGAPFTLAVPTSQAEHWFVRTIGPQASARDKFIASLSSPQVMLAQGLTLTMSGQSFTVEKYESRFAGDPKSGNGNSKMTFFGMSASPELLAAANPDNPLKQLGYDNIHIDLSVGADTKVTDDIVAIAMRLNITSHGMGALLVSAAVSAIPITALDEIDKADKEGREPDFQALMSHVGKTTFEYASIRFEDQSITKKVLPMVAAMQGMDEKTMLATVGPMMEMGLMQLQNQAFADQALAAVNSFLADPKSLTITASPASPVKVSDLMTLNPAAPGEAITKLGVSVSAND